jgi:hypothetical protein
MSQRTSQESGAAPTPVARSAWPGIAAWGGVSLLVVLQYLLFRQYAEREVVWAYPSRYDQTVFLASSYETFEEILSGGIWHGLQHGFGLRLQNGTLLHIQASLVYLLFGASRLSALTVNFGLFAALQYTLVWTVRWYSGRWSVAFVGLGMLLSAATPFCPAGGMVDFNLNFGAFCLFGIFVCLVLRSGTFASVRWSLMAGGMAAAVVLFRFLTLTYFAGMFGLLLAALLLQCWLQRRNRAARRLVRRRLGGLLAAAVVLLSVAGPVLWLNWEGIRQYYLIQARAEKPIRLKVFGLSTDVERLLYYPRSLLGDHLGTTLLVLGGSVLLAALVLGRRRLRRPAGENSNLQASPGTPFLFIALSLLVPLGALTANGSPSPLVANLMVTGAIWLVLLAALWLWRLPGVPHNPAAIPWLSALAVPVLAVGTYAQASSWSQHSTLSRDRADVEQVAEFYDVMTRHSQQMGWTAPGLSVNFLSDYFWLTVLKPFAYERHHVLLQPRPLLGFGLFAVTEAQAVEFIRKSDFVIMNRTPYRDYVIMNRMPLPLEPLDPFQQGMEKMRPRLLALCEQQLVPLRDFHLFNQDVTLYARPGLTVSGGSVDHWISGGLKLSGSSAVLRRFPRIELCGRVYMALLSKVPRAHATVQTPGKPARTMSADVKVTGDQYRIRVDLDPATIAASSNTTIQLEFDTYFVPKEKSAIIGPSEDRRRLVMATPDQVQLLPRVVTGRSEDYQKVGQAQRDGRVSSSSENSRDRLRSSCVRNRDRPNQRKRKTGQ